MLQLAALLLQSLFGLKFVWAVLLCGCYGMNGTELLVFWSGLFPTSEFSGLLLLSVMLRKSTLHIQSLGFWMNIKCQDSVPDEGIDVRERDPLLGDSAYLS